MVENNSLICPSKKELTNAEKEVLDMITIKFYSLKQMQVIRKCSRQAVYKIVKSLKKKGVLNLGLQAVNKNESSCQPNQVRLHGQEFNIKLIWQDNRYQELINKSNVLYLDGHTIRLYSNSIEIYAGEGISFYGEDSDRAYKKSIEYWNRFFIKLEHEIKAIIIKNNCKNIKEVNWHFARGDSEICENARETGKRIRVYCPIDGKLAYLTDESFRGREDETVHPITAKIDRKAIDKQVNDWRLNNPPTNSELSRNIAEVTQNQQVFAQNMLSHISAIQELGKGVKKLTRVMKGILSENRQLKLDNKHQKRLSEFQ